MAATYATIRGFHCRLSFSAYQSESIVVRFDGCESEEEAKAVAVAAARNSYPCGTIDVAEVTTGKWCPTGLPANADGSAVWAT